MKLAVAEAGRILLRSLSRERRRELATITVLMPATAVAEAAMVAAIVPFIALLVGRHDSMPAFGDLNNPLHLLQQLTSASPLVVATTLFALLAVVTALLRLALSWSSQHFAFAVGHDLAIETQRRLLHQPYSFHLHRHSSEMLATLDKIDHLIFNLFLQTIQATGAGLVGLFVIGLLIAIDPLSAGLSLLLLGGLFILAMIAARRGFARHAGVIGTAYDHRLRIVQEGVGAIREVILDQSQAAQIDRFRVVDQHFMQSRARTGFLMAAPRHLVEAAGLLLIACLAVAIAGRNGGIEAALPILGALALGAHRLLPQMGQLYSAWANLASSGPIMSDIACILTLPVPDDAICVQPMPFSHEIRFEEVGYLYPDRVHHALHDVSMIIPKGSRVAITGQTGSGKTTFADLLMGLISPTEGRIIVDETELHPANLPGWRKSIAHVPQSIFLADASIAANIALTFDGSQPNMDRVRRAAHIAQLDGFVETLPLGYDTMVGENAIRLSGGQRQRLALARALYKQAPILVLDEATSALDETTEAAVIAALDELQAEGCTIIVIAHRQSTLAKCDAVFVLEDGKLTSCSKRNRPRQLVSAVV